VSKVCSRWSHVIGVPARIMKGFNNTRQLRCAKTKSSKHPLQRNKSQESSILNRLRFLRTTESSFDPQLAKDGLCIEVRSFLWNKITCQFAISKSMSNFKYSVRFNSYRPNPSSWQLSNLEANENGSKGRS